MAENMQTHGYPADSAISQGQCLWLNKLPSRVKRIRCRADRKQMRPVLPTGVIVTALLLASCDPSQLAGEPPVVSASIAVMPHSFTSYSVFVAREKGFFQEKGVEVQLKHYPQGKATLAALKEEEADFAVSSETPFIRAVLSGDEISTVAVTLRAHRHLAVVARRDRGIEKVADLQGKRVGVTEGSNGEYFLDVVLRMHGLGRERIEVVHLVPGKMTEALAAGEVDAIATWNPQMRESRDRLGANGVAFDAHGLYSPQFLLVSSSHYINAKPETTQRVLGALIKASAFIRDSPDAARLAAAKHMKTEPETLRRLSADYEFDISLNQSLLTILENQTEWLLTQGPPGSREAPVYLEHIDLRALEAVSPFAVGIIH
jgi:NitT/TauT family transport system substrate-binding protein